jgi:hypothetical protein
VHVEIVADGLLELSGRTMRAAADVVLGQRGEPALDLIEPGRRSRRKVDVEPRVACEPGPDRGRLVSAVVVHYEVDIHLRCHVGLDGAQELQEFAAAVSAVQLADDLAGFSASVELSFNIDNSQFSARPVLAVTFFDVVAGTQNGVSFNGTADVTLTPGTFTADPDGLGISFEETGISIRAREEASAPLGSGIRLGPAATQSIDINLLEPSLHWDAEIGVDLRLHELRLRVPDTTLWWEAPTETSGGLQPLNTLRTELHLTPVEPCGPIGQCGFDGAFLTWAVTPVPEPISAVLVLPGLAGLVALKARRRCKTRCQDAHS